MEESVEQRVAILEKEVANHSVTMATFLQDFDAATNSIKQEIKMLKYLFPKEAGVSGEKISIPIPNCDIYLISNFRDSSNTHFKGYYGRVKLNFISSEAAMRLQLQPQVVELQSPIELDLKIGKLPIKNVCTNVGIRVGATEKVVRADFHVIPMTCDFILGDAFHDVVQLMLVLHFVCDRPLTRYHDLYEYDTEINEYRQGAAWDIVDNPMYCFHPTLASVH
ncbi:hypothetical protein FXO37_36772 [Capsicum annuum]|nr:hypothetical protein FXO37_36772 [Capsicum annuum]